MMKNKQIELRSFSLIGLLIVCLLTYLDTDAQTVHSPKQSPVPEITWKHPYHQTLMMKIFLSEVEPVKGDGKQVKVHDKGESKVILDFEQTMEVIRKIDQLTLGIPKIIYLVGWQYNGHDSKYPAWGEVNPKLKRPQDTTALESMKWLMEEALRYHTTVSVHINMFDAYNDSPLWDTYVENNIIARNADGSLKEGEWGWPVSYTQEWNTGYAQKRIDAICDMLPLTKAGTVHIDAFHTWPPYEPDGSPISPYLGFTAGQETETQRKIFRYWAGKGIDVTSEGMRFLRLSAFEGLQPAAWWYSPSIDEYMKWPAAYYCGGTTNEPSGKLFGRSMHGESIIRKDPVQLNGFLREFCTRTLPWYFLNRLERKEYVGEQAYQEVHFSENVVSRLNGEMFTITRDDKTILQDEDVFIPPLWLNIPAVIAYSTKGYKDREWELPDEWSRYKAANLYRITINGLNMLPSTDIRGRKINLSLDAGEAVVVVPYGTTDFGINNIEEERYILTPPPSSIPRINGAKVVGASPGKPFLFTIATTGERPLTFKAKGLPKGFVLDKEKGIISGCCQKQGTYFVSVTATNSKGICRDTIEIRIGENQLALTPHMGWNSWYVYGPYVTQEIMEKSAQAMYDEGLVDYGYTYINIDDGWQVKVRDTHSLQDNPARNMDGTIRPNQAFPDMKRLTGLIHRLGMKAGIYSSPGRTTCGGYAGSLGYEALDMQTYNQWGFDFLKYDWCSYGDEVKNNPPSPADYKKPYELIGKLCKEGDRDIILNLCQYGMGDVWKWGKEVGGQSWRTTGDIGDTNNLLASMFRIGFFQEELKDYSGPGGWNDPDYLLFGDIYDFEKNVQRKSPLSASEHYTCMTLWSMMSAPLIFSGNITTLDDFTRNILCNAEVIDVNQDKWGKQGYRIYSKELIEIWKKDLVDGNTVIAIFNKRPIRDSIEIDWKTLGYTPSDQVRDLWRQVNIGTTEENNVFDIPRHGCLLLKITH
jgi:hypothetical protein